MGSKKPYGLPPGAPHQAQDEDTHPSLEVVDYFPPGKRPKKLVGGAYNPYETPVPTGNTVRVQKPRTDLRQLSAWIKTRKEVEALREEHGDDIPEQD